MKNTNIVIYLLKGCSLLVLDIVTFMLTFSVWAFVNMPLFPWALCAILFSLVLLNLVVLVSSKSIELFGVGAYASALICTFLFYIFVMVFTGVTYIGITPRWYVIITLIATLLYILVILGLCISGLNKNKDMLNQETEKAKVLDVTLQLMTIDANIKSCSNFVEEESYAAINEAFVNMDERITASTPFGRITKPVVINLEDQIVLKLSAISDDVTSLKSISDQQKACKSVVESLSDVKNLIINREKLIIK